MHLSWKTITVASVILAITAVGVGVIVFFLLAWTPLGNLACKLGGPTNVDDGTITGALGGFGQCLGLTFTLSLLAAGTWLGVGVFMLWRRSVVGVRKPTSNRR
jgi:hypothetical protein